MALGSATFSGFGGAVSDLFAGFGDLAKAKGDVFEKQNYELAATLAQQNEEFAKQSTAVRVMQADRELSKAQGQTAADVAGAGFAMSGSAIDIMRENASQGALTKQVLGQQGLITEAGYQEQAQSYENMAQAAQVAIDAEKKAATGAFISGGIKAITGVASLF